MTYQDILKSDFFFETYSKIEFEKRNFPVNHGFVHIWHVLCNARKLAKFFNLNAHEEELLYIACTLHDIGYIMGREDHAKNGEIAARQFLKDKLPQEDIDTICTAIANHGGHEQKDYEEKVSLCLVLADKMDFVKTRYREDEKHASVKSFMTVEDVELVKKPEKIELEITSNDPQLLLDNNNSYFFNKLKLVMEKLSHALSTPMEINIVKK